MAKLNMTVAELSGLLAIVGSLPAVGDLLTRQDAERDYQPKGDYQPRGDYLTKHQSLAGYATAAALQTVSAALEQLQGLHNALLARFETLVGDSGNVSAVIDSYREMEAFLSGVTNQQTLTGMLSDMRADIVGLIPTGTASQSDLDALVARVATLEGKATAQETTVSTLHTDLAKRPAVPSSAVTGTVYAVKDGAYVAICDPTEQLLSAKRST